MLLLLGCSLLWLIGIIVLATRKAGKRMLYPIVLYFDAWTLSSLLTTPEMEQTIMW